MKDHWQSKELAYPVCFSHLCCGLFALLPFPIVASQVCSLSRGVLCQTMNICLVCLLLCEERFYKSFGNALKAIRTMHFPC